MRNLKPVFLFLSALVVLAIVPVHAKADDPARTAPLPLPPKADPPTAPTPTPAPPAPAPQPTAVATPDAGTTPAIEIVEEKKEKETTTTTKVKATPPPAKAPPPGKLPPPPKVVVVPGTLSEEDCDTVKTVSKECRKQTGHKNPLDGQPKTAQPATPPKPSKPAKPAEPKSGQECEKGGTVCIDGDPCTENICTTEHKCVFRKIVSNTCPATPPSPKEDGQALFNFTLVVSGKGDKGDPGENAAASQPAPIKGARGQDGKDGTRVDIGLGVMATAIFPGRTTWAFGPALQLLFELNSKNEFLLEGAWAPGHDGATFVHAAFTRYLGSIQLTEDTKLKKGNKLDIGITFGVEAEWIDLTGNRAEDQFIGGTLGIVLRLPFTDWLDLRTEIGGFGGGHGFDNFEGTAGLSGSLSLSLRAY